MRSVPHCSLRPLPSSQSPSFLTPLTLVNFVYFSATYIFTLLHIYLGTMMMIDHDIF
jgi:hypothetical protein